MEKIFVYDTTLRDGSQGEDVNFSGEEKMQVARELDELGVDYIEGGWPGSNPGDEEFFRLARKYKFKNSRLVAFGSTRRAKKSVEENKNLAGLLQSGAKAVALVGKSWDKQVKLMNVSLKENLAMIRDSVSFLKKKGLEVIFDAEHFFDGYKSNPEYALKTLGAAREAGADFLVLCDTRGGSMFWEVEKIISETIASRSEYCEVKFGIHAHNDGNLAEANTLAAVRAGACMIQGTINGYGERCGNADLTSVIPSLQLKMEYDCLGEKIEELCRVSGMVSEIANMTPYKGRPFVGRSAFAHKGGIHTNLVKKDPASYEHIVPEEVGNQRRILISDLAGVSSVRHKAEEMGIDLTDEQLKEVTSLIKKKESQGFKFEAADASLALLIKKQIGEIEHPFNLQSFTVHVHKEEGRHCASQANIKIGSNGETVFKGAEGNGPVDALNNAFLKALTKMHHRILKNTHLFNFKVRVVNGGGTQAKVRVLTQFRDGSHIWSTVGVSEDIIEASWQALWDGMFFKLSGEVNSS